MSTHQQSVGVVDIPRNIKEGGMLRNIVEYKEQIVGDDDHIQKI